MHSFLSVVKSGPVPYDGPEVATPRPRTAALPAAAGSDVVQVSEAAKARLEGRRADDALELAPSYAQQWEEARQSLLRDPMEPAHGEEELGPDELSDEDQAVVDELRARDAEVRAHEAAHAAIAGGIPTYVYQRGPDGKQYAVGGEVTISMRGGSTAQQTADRMARVRAATLAPNSPSVQDMAVAAEATLRQVAARARDDENRTGEVVRRSEKAASAFEAQRQLAERESPRQVAWA